MSLLGVDQKDFDRLKNEFDKFKVEMNEKVVQLNSEIALKVSDSEEAARNAANNAESYAQKSLDAKATVLGIIGDLEQCLNLAREESSKVSASSLDLEKKLDLIKSKESTYNAIHDEIVLRQNKLMSDVAEIIEKNNTLNSAIEKSSELPSHIESIKQLLESANKIHGDINSLFGHSMKRKAEIDNLHKEINGYDIKSNENESEVEHIDGLKDELRKKYDDLSDKSNNLNMIIQKSIHEISDDYRNKLGTSVKQIEDLFAESEKKIIAVNGQLTGLLPGAMAEGLSAAYEAKKDQEIISQRDLEKSFMQAIFCMVGISLIPFFVDVHLLFWKNSELLTVIKDTPNLIVAILPLYFPVLWFAYATNKKLNLSKRLIEEYTHKSTLGRTFAGLSNQIESFSQDGEVKNELRARLLFNFLQVTSENPGKLITNYERADHPVMDVLENSSKLTASVEALAKIPGFSAVASKLAKKSDEILEKEKARVLNGLAYQDALDDTKDESPESPNAESKVS